MIRARVITCSDGVFAGKREDKSGLALRDVLERNGYSVDAVVVVPDDIEFISRAIREAVDIGITLVATTGGTGISARDVTPEATTAIADRVIPGFGELMRAKSLEKTSMAPLSRAQAATRGSALILNLPGSVNGACENLKAVLHLIPHALDLLSGRTADHPK